MRMRWVYCTRFGVDGAAGPVSLRGGGDVIRPQARLRRNPNLSFVAAYTRRASNL